MLLINTVGFVACSAVAVIGIKSVYHASQVEQYEEDYDVEIPLEERNITADVVGLAVEIVRFGLYVIEDFTDKLFDSRLANWLRGLYPPETDEEDDFPGWEDEAPRFKPGKFEFEM
jgi:hypothetical protein